MKYSFVFKKTFGMFAGVCLVLGSYSASASETEWVAEEMTQQGATVFSVTGISGTNNGYLFGFLEGFEGCHFSIGHLVPFKEAFEEKTMANDVKCTVLVDDGVTSRKSHDFNCFVVAEAGDRHATFTLLPESWEQKQLMKDIQDAKRIGFTAMGNYDIWHDTTGMEQAMKAGYGYCGLDVPTN